MIKNKIQQQIYFKIFLIFTLLNTLQAQEKHVNSPKLFIQGNHNYSELKIQSIIKEEWEQYVKTRKLHFIDDAVYILQNHYKNNGYSFVQVDYEYEQDITIYVQEYYPVVIKKITIQSATEQTLSMPIAELYSLLTPKPLTTPHYLKQEILEQDITNIKNYYKNRSFLDVRVQLLIQYSPEPPESQRADVQINIYEGPKYFLTNLSFQGNNSFPAEQLLQEKMPKPYIPSMMQEYVRKIKSYYKNNAFAKIEIKTNVSQKEDNHQIHKTIHFVIKENRKYTIKNIQIKGNQKVNTSYIQTKLEILENQLYNAQKIQQTKKNLFNTGLFLNVDIQEQYIDQEQNMKEGTTNLIILVQERPDNTVNLSLGYDTSYGVTAGIEYEILSILGTGLKTILSLDGTIVSSNLTKRQAKIEFVEPEFLE
ncbi:MAG TPA: POTRA domain-containing protein, partial [Planctomycetota bacterium]|nr:POTRA domain-containing protein [Planctomycetota bacterium]